MTAAVILTDKESTSSLCKKISVLPLIDELRPYFHEIILTTSKPALYLPVVKDQARILKPYFKGPDPLPSLHSSLSLAASDTVWLLHELEDYPGIQLFKELFSLKQSVQSQAVLCYSEPNISFVHGIYDRSVLNVLHETLNKEEKYDDHGENFLQQINYVHYQTFETKSL